MKAIRLFPILNLTHESRAGVLYITWKKADYQAESDCPAAPLLQQVHLELINFVEGSVFCAYILLSPLIPSFSPYHW